ncbi:MAG: FtsQ-type POTRA domain-containing protein [Candidatus Tectomicrobia bacterium]
MLLAVISSAAQGAQRRPGRLKRLLAWVWFSSKCLTGITLCVALVWASYTAYQWVRDAEYFRLRTIQIMGNQTLTRDDVLYLLAIPPDATLLQLDLPSTAARLARHPSVKAVALRRRFPDALTVTMQERSPYLVVDSKGQHMVLDAEGVVLRPFMPRRDQQLPQFALHPKRVLTPGMRLRQKNLQRAMELVQAYHDSSVMRMLHLSSLTVEDSGVSIWEVEPYDFVIRIGAGEVKAQLERLPSVLRYITQKDLAVRLVDVSYRQRVIVKLRASS